MLNIMRSIENHTIVSSQRHPPTQSLHCFANMSEASRLVAKRELIDLAEAAYQAQGLAAFAYPKSAAAAHEAGHVVEYAATGRPVQSTKIFSRKLIDQPGLGWAGLTKAQGGEISITPLSPPEHDLATARHQIAGVVAEMIVDTENFRLGSSLDEVILFKMIVGNAATKLGRDRVELGQMQLGLVAYVFSKNEELLRAIAAQLFRGHQVRGKKLTRLLAGVVQVNRDVASKESLPQSKLRKAISSRLFRRRNEPAPN